MKELTKPEHKLIPLKDKAALQRVRAVHAVLMRWCVEGLAVDEILREHPMSLPEFAAQRRVRDAFEAKAGTLASIKAVDKLILLIDGSDGQEQPQSPTTFIERHIETADGETTTVREVRKSVVLEESNE
jgi:hypothetical protein